MKQIVPFKTLIQEELDKKFLLDLAAMMKTEQGRRIYSWILQKCGVKDIGIKGNSQDFYLSGRKSVAMELSAACDAIGMLGVDLRQAAEKEYLLLQMSIGEDIKKKGVE